MPLLILLGIGCGSGSPRIADDTAEGPPALLDDTSVETLPESDACAPGAAPSFVTEGEAVTVTVACTGAGSAAGFVASSLPPGASFDAASGTLSWTPGLAQAGTWDVGVAVAERPGDAGTFRVWVADAWDAAGNVPVEPLAYEEEWGLPVLHLERPPATNPDGDVESTATWRGHTYTIGLKYRGASSLSYPKNSYTLSFPPDDEFRDDASGFEKRRKIVLTTLFDDNSYVRQKLCFDVWTALSADHAPMQSLFAVVYINGVYEGLYLLGDHVDGEYWEDAGFREDGNLYKSVDHSANFYDTYGGREKSSLHQGYEKKEGDPPDGEAGAWDDLDAFVAFVIEEDDAAFAEGLAARAAVDEFMDWWILVTFSLAEDSGGKNAYLYDDPLAPGWHYAPWDFNDSWGQSWETSRTSARSDDDFTWTNNLFARMLADPSLSPALLARLHAATAGVLAPDALRARVEGYYAEIDPSAARDWARWGPEYRAYFAWRDDFTTYEEERAYLDTWIGARSVFMDRTYPE